MIYFLFGLIVGGSVGLFISAILTVSHDNDIVENYRTRIKELEKKLGEKD